MTLRFYKKHNSFLSLSIKDRDKKTEISQEIIQFISNSNLNNFSNKERQILNTVKKDLLNPNENDDNIFRLNDNVIDELISFEKKDILNYLVHRYRYEIFPKKKNS